MRIGIEEVPLEVRRRAATFVASFQATQKMDGGQALRLSGVACPLFRPDIEGVAYWEIELTGAKAAPHAKAGHGFVIAAAGRHDIPIPHFSLAAPPPSRALEARAAEHKISRIFKLDALAYVAEDANGAHIAHLRELPPRITHQLADANDGRAIATFQAVPSQPSAHDEGPVPEHKIVTSGKDARPQLSAWKSWEECKKGYASTYKTQLAALQARASGSWHTEELIGKFGEGIHAGQSLIVPLLKPGKGELAGKGASLVKLTVLDATSIQLVASDAAGTAEVDFDLHLQYGDGTSETLKFFVVPKGTPTRFVGVAPHLTARPGGN